MMMWEKDVKFFGKTLQSFSSSEEAIQRIGRFLDADADDYRVDVSMKDINVVELLNSMVVKV